MAARSHPDWRQALVESYADLFRPVGDPPTAAGWPAVGDGWRDLIESACMRMRPVVAEGRGAFRIVQIKEKFGTLRVHWEGSLPPDDAVRVEEFVDLAEARSAVTCDVCGEPGVLRAGGWLATRCDDHAGGRPAVPFEEGFENLHAESRFVDGRWVTRFRFYDRAGDRFVEAGRPRRRGK